jgi:formylglycine-generating enzyme required for sulfatase activity
MKLFKTLFTLAFAMSAFVANAQPWIYDFGVANAGAFSSTFASTSYLPAPPSGTARVRVGNPITAAGSFTLANPGEALGSGTELQMLSNAGSASTTKFSVHDYTPGNTGYLKFKITLNGGTNGVYTCWVGDGNTFSESNAMANAQVFAGLRWSFGASNTITYTVSGPTGTFGTTGISNSTTLFTQSLATSYSVELYMNNSTDSSSYGRNAISFTMAAGTWDLWVDGVLVGDDLAKAGLTAAANFDSFAFSHQVSASAPGRIYLDDIQYSNNLPSEATPNISASPSTICPYESSTITVTGVPNSIIQLSINDNQNQSLTLDSTGNGSLVLSNISATTTVMITAINNNIPLTLPLTVINIDGYCASQTSTLPSFMLVQDVITTSDNPVNKTIQIQFDLSWGFSWRDSINWDAAWVFAKYKGTDGVWRHAKLNNTGFSINPSKTIEVTSDKLGAFIYSAYQGQGTSSAFGTQLQWNYGLDGLTSVTGLEVRVFAVEMVYVPQGDFNVAKRFNGGNLFTAPGDNFPVVNTRLTPSLTYNDGTAATIRIKGDAGIDSNNDGSVDKPDYPTGYRPFYCYKYELTEQQYADFLNCLTPAQRSNHGIAGAGITLANGEYFSSAPNRACGNMTAQRMLAYADWSGMRPMTILEMNKASYGPLQPIQTQTNYFAAGTSNSGYSGNNLVDVGPYDSGATTRAQSGSSYYGIDDLTGNAREHVVSLNFLNFNATNGDGVLDVSGNHNVNGWNTSGMLIPYEQFQFADYAGYYIGIRYVRSAE